MDLISSTDLKLLESVGATIERLQEADLEEWFDHVALVFSKTGRGYFVDHYNAQPNLKHILVAKSAETGKIISTMRIFEHQIVIGAEFVRCAGVGEVSTHPDWRQKGLAGVLLRTLQFLMISEGFSVSSLHTSSVNFYSKFGYNLLAMENVVLTVAVGDKEDISEGFEIQPLEAVTPVWRNLYQQLCDSHVLQGIVLRDEDYWTNRIPKEVQRMCGKQAFERHYSALPLSANTPFAAECGFQWIDSSDSTKCAVFLSAQIESAEPPVLKIRELIASPALVHDISTLRKALHAFIKRSVNPQWDQFVLKCSGALWRLFAAPSIFESELGLYRITNVESSTSDGIMYKSLSTAESEHTMAADGLEPLKSANHVFLPLDGF